jgi:hypothetical protein
MFAQPVASRPSNGRDIRNPATAGRNAHIPLGHSDTQMVKLVAHRRPNVRNRIRNQFLSNAKELHATAIVWNPDYPFT